MLNIKKGGFFMQSLLKNYQEVMLREKEKLEAVVKPYETTNDIIKENMQAIRKLYATKLESNKPQIMVYGIYNAGKSSIINELVGKDVAKVEDKPTTDKVESVSTIVTTLHLSGFKGKPCGALTTL